MASGGRVTKKRNWIHLNPIYGRTRPPTILFGQENDDEFTPKEYRYDSRMCDPRDLAVQTATAEERGVTPSTAGQDDGGGPNPASGSLQPEGIRQERSGISLRRQITTGTWNVQEMTQGKMTVV